MRQPGFISTLALAMTAALTATADTGRFTSFSTTVTRSQGQLDFNVGIDTTGAVPPGTTSSPDYVYVLGYVFEPTGTGYGSASTLIPRSGIGTGAFSGSFSITGLDDRTSYKWLTIGVGDLAGMGYGYGGFFYAIYFLYFGCIPFTTSSSVFITTPSGTGTVPIACTTSPTGGPLYDFLNSDVNNFNTTLNWWYSTSGGSSFPLLANGVSTGRASGIAPIPALTGWGLLVLGTLLGTTGFILLGRA